jgi:hypothetical protein
MGFFTEIETDGEHRYLNGFGVVQNQDPEVCVVAPGRVPNDGSE